MVRPLENMICEERLEDLGLFNLGKSRRRRDLINLHIKTIKRFIRRR